MKPGRGVDWAGGSFTVIEPTLSAGVERSAVKANAARQSAAMRRRGLLSLACMKVAWALTS